MREVGQDEQVRTWDTLEQGDVIVERLALGARAYVVLRVEEGRAVLLNLESACECHVGRPVALGTTPLEEMYEVIERA